MKTTHELAKILLNKPNVPVRHHCIYQDDFQDNPTQLISTVELIFENGKCYISHGMILDEFLDIMDYWDNEDV